MKKRIILTILIIFLTGSNASLFSHAQTQQQIQQEIDKLGEDIKFKKSEIDDLDKKIQKYQRNIEAKRKEASNLKTQISILDNKIKTTELEIDKKEKQVDEKNLEIQNVTLRILEKELVVKDKKKKLAELVKLIYKNSQRNTLEIMVLNKSFSDFYNKLKVVENIQKSLKQSINQIKEDKQKMMGQKEELEQKSHSLSKLKKQFETKEVLLGDQRGIKSVLMVQTKQSQKEYERLIELARKEQQAANADISKYEIEIRKKLIEKGLVKTGPVNIIWPVDSQRITAYFHDPDYPYRKAFEHSGIDIAIPQGTAVKVAADGYVARTKSGGNSGYGYIMVVHNSGISTVYGHINKILVKEEEYVVQGQVIARSGGMPGTQGAGPFSTGPHLHFEIRKDGIPNDPFNYLPQ